MPRIALYLDEHIQSALVLALKARGVDILTTQEAGNIGLDDREQLIYATQNNRTVLSYNRQHLAKLHYQWMSIHKSHSGIILSDQMPVGMVLRRLMRLHFSLASEDMLNRLEYLSVWK